MHKFLACLLIAIANPVWATPLEDLQAFSPTLATLPAEYPQQVPQLQTYAKSQDFTDPHEQLTVVVHELIHIASAAHQGYWVRGTIYDGYTRHYWQGLKASDVDPTPGERNQMAAILNNYWERNPANDMGNVVDEINAYGETVPFVCAYAPTRASRQVQPLIGHLTLLNAWLRAFRTLNHSRYVELQSTNATRGIIDLTVHQAWQTLSQCGVRQISHQEEIQTFLANNFYQ